MAQFSVIRQLRSCCLDERKLQKPVPSPSGTSEHPLGFRERGTSQQCGQGPHMCLALPPAWQRAGEVPEEVSHLPRPLLTLRERCQLENSRKDSDHQGEVDLNPNPSISHYCVIFHLCLCLPICKMERKVFPTLRAIPLHRILKS